MNLGEDSEAKISQDFEFKLSRVTVVCWRVWSEYLIEILRLKFDQDVCKKL